MGVYLKRSAVDLNSGILACQNLCQCNRKSFVGVDIIVNGQSYRYSWEELDAEIAVRKK